jgi:hypothetical protein
MTGVTVGRMPTAVGTLGCHCGTFFTHLLDCTTPFVCHRVSMSQPGRLLCTLVHFLLPAIAAVVFNILVRPGGYMVCSVGCWCLGTVRKLPQCYTVYMYIYFMRWCDETFIICFIYVHYCLHSSLSTVWLHPDVSQHIVSCCSCTIYFGICISQFVDITAVRFAHHVFASSGIADELNSWGNQSQN